MAGLANDAKKMLELLGGKENIVSFTHCATRMRFVLKDQKQADVKAIEELSCVKGSFTQGGQFQIIIGNKVSTFYDDFVEASGIEGVSKAEVKTRGKRQSESSSAPSGKPGRGFCADYPGNYRRRSDPWIP